MSSVTIQNVTKQFGPRVVLDGLTLHIQPGETAGLIGPNGAGKTTLFRLIAREIEPDFGTITYAKNLAIGYLRQEPQISLDHTLHEEVASSLAEMAALERRLEELSERIAHSHGQADHDAVMAEYERANARFLAGGGHAYRAQIDEVLSGLGFSNSEFQRPLREFSGGQRCRAALAKLLLQDAAMLLLDEPTNHLDIDAIYWLEKFLKTHTGGALVVSHDRYFLDRTCTRIVELLDGKVNSYPGNYSNFVQIKENLELTQQREFEKQQAFIAKEQAYIAKHLAGQRSRQAKGRRTRLERGLASGELGVAAPRQRQSARIAFGESEAESSELLRCDELAAGFGDRPLVSGLNLQLRSGERLGITGPNGTGKTTLLRTLLGEMPPMGGSFVLASGVKIGYYAQTSVQLDPENDLVAEIRSVCPSFSELQARSYLGRFLFRNEDVFKKIALLSGGEQSRVRLAKLILSAPDLLVLDEPTNHLDIPSREALEDALADFSGTVITVSHDRYFLDRVISRLLLIRREGHTVFRGNYSDYIAEQERLQLVPRAGASGLSAAPQAKKRSDAKKASAATAASSSAAAKRATAQYDHLNIEQLEEMVLDREIKLAEMHEKFGDPALYKDPDALAELQEEIDALTEELAVIDAAWHERAETL